MDERLTDLSAQTVNHLLGLAISIGIGFLIGLERSFSQQAEKEEEFAGLRTFTLISVFGYLTALLASLTTIWLVVAAFTGLVAFVSVSYFRLSAITNSAGTTSEFAALLTFLLGVLVFYNFVLLALIIMVVILLLLAFKPSLHHFVQKLSKEELVAIIQFVIISALVIPFLPDSNFGPYKLWNLKDIWKMVILVSGTSLVGYLIAKFIGNKGTMAAGIVGGLVSSTAVSLTFSRRSKEEKASNAAFYFAMAIISACTVMFPRILFEVYVVNRALAAQMWIPITLTTLAGFGAAFFILKRKKTEEKEAPLELKNPLNFATAIQFALFFAGVMLLVKFSSENFGDNGTYIAGAISGVTDVDAITLSMAKMAKNNDASAVAINTILIAALANTLVKFFIVLLVGSRQLLRIASIGFGAIFITGISCLLFYFFR